MVFPLSLSPVLLVILMERKYTLKDLRFNFSFMNYFVLNSQCWLICADNVAAQSNLTYIIDTFYDDIGGFKSILGDIFQIFES